MTDSISSYESPKKNRAPLNVSIDPIAFSKRVRDLRQVRGMSKPELAAAAGLSARTIHELEAGRRNRVQEKTLLLLAGVFDLDYSALLNESQKPRPFHTTPQPATSPMISNQSRPRLLIPALTVFLVVILGSVLIAERSMIVTSLSDNTLTGHSSLSGRTIWQLDVAAKIHFTDPSPWSKNEILVGLWNDSLDGGRLLLVHTRTGKIIWSVQPDMSQVLKSFKSEHLYDGGGFLAYKTTPIDLDGDLVPELAAEFMHGRYWPHTILMVTRDGHIHGQYDNRGHIYDSLATDLNGDGCEELIVAATNNASCYQGASLIMLDAQCCHGAASDSLAGGAVDLPDSSRVRLVLPSFGAPYMDLINAVRLNARQLSIVRDEEGSLRISALIGFEDFNVMVTLDSQLNPLSVSASDSWPKWAADWPAEASEAGGPQNKEWLDAWLKRGVRFEAGHWNGDILDSVAMSE